LEEPWVQDKVSPAALLYIYNIYKARLSKLVPLDHILDLTLSTMYRLIGREMMINPGDNRHPERTQIVS